MEGENIDNTELAIKIKLSACLLIKWLQSRN
jgi:hypothetical protein